VNDEVEVRRRDRYKEDADGYLRIDRCLVCGWGGIDRSVDHGGYFNRELVNVADEWPRMGPLCAHCNRRIPRFLDLTPEPASRARGLIKAGRMDDAIQSIRESTGSPLTWARLWVEHPDGPISAPA
jgi:hypothetical protein